MRQEQLWKISQREMNRGNKSRNINLGRSVGLSFRWLKKWSRKVDGQQSLDIGLCETFVIWTLAKSAVVEEFAR